MSRYKQISRLAYAVSAATALTACSDSGSGSGGGGGPVQVASDACLVADVGAAATFYNGGVADYVEDSASGKYTFSIVEQPADGQVTILNANTGQYSFIPTDPGARGYKTSFTYGVLENGEQVDSAEVELIYGDRRIMPLGDSITYGVTNFDGTNNNPSALLAAGYRKPLYDSLVNAGYAVDFVGSFSGGAGAGLADTNHQGFPGHRADEVDASVTGYLISNPPDVVLSHVGTNDLFQGRTPAQAATNVNSLMTTMQTWRENLLDTQEQDLTVLVARIIPSYASGGTTSTPDLPTIQQFNDAMVANLNADAGFSGDAKFNYVIVDQYSALNPATDLTTLGFGVGEDRVGLHPNAVGYNEMARTWHAALVDSGAVHKCD